MKFVPLLSLHALSWKWSLFSLNSIAFSTVRTIHWLQDHFQVALWLLHPNINPEMKEFDFNLMPRSWCYTRWLKCVKREASVRTHNPKTLSTIRLTDWWGFISTTVLIWGVLFGLITVGWKTTSALCLPVKNTEPSCFKLESNELSCLDLS